MNKPVADKFAVDWGLSRMRLWALRGNKVIGEVENDNGAGIMTTSADYENALIKAASAWLPKTKGDNAKVAVLICGMAGARDGWQQTPYRYVPCAPLADDGLPMEVATTDKRIKVFIVPGLAQTNPCNVMRGEETQIAGLLAMEKEFDGAICLPGSHAKWARIKGGKVRKFETMMTGELYALLSNHSALRHCTKSINDDDKSFDEDAFAEAADEVMRRPSMMASKLFSVRAQSILQNTPPKVARSRLSGFCIGADIAAAKQYCQSGRVAIIGAKDISKRYQSALQLRGIKTSTTTGNKAALRGMQTIRIK